MDAATIRARRVVDWCETDDFDRGVSVSVVMTDHGPALLPANSVELGAAMARARIEDLTR